MTENNNETKLGALVDDEGVVKGFGFFAEYGWSYRDQGDWLPITEEDAAVQESWDGLEVVYTTPEFTAVFDAAELEGRVLNRDDVPEAPPEGDVAEGERITADELAALGARAAVAAMERGDNHAAQQAIDTAEAMIDALESGEDIMSAAKKADRSGRLMTAVEWAQTLATKAHRGQVDKAGNPYIGHPARVASAVAGDATSECVAWLHDVVEDTDLTLDDVRAVFSDVVADAVDAISRRDGELDVEYYMRVVANDVARQVKLADIADNSDPDRLALLDADLRDRLVKKYEAADKAVRYAGHYYLTSDSRWRINLDSGALCYEESDGHSDWGHVVQRGNLDQVYGALGIGGLGELIGHLQSGGDVSRGLLSEHDIPHELFRWP